VNVGTVPYGIIDRDLMQVAMRNKQYENLKVLNVFLYHGSYHFAFRKDLDPQILTNFNATLIQLQESGRSSKMCGLYLSDKSACVL